MTEITCETVRIAAMAIADGEDSTLRQGEIEMHLVNCESCRVEIAQLQSLNDFLNLHQRLQPQVEVWPIVKERIEAKAGTPMTLQWRLLLLFVVPLFGHKLLLLMLQAPPRLWTKLVPILLVIAVFVYLKTNPFKINSELSLKGESGLL